MKSGYSGPSVRISDEDLLDCLQFCATPKRERDGIAAEESLCSGARLVAPGPMAADMPRFIGSLFDAMCKFVAEAGSTGFFMKKGDVSGSWKPAPAHFLPVFFRMRYHPTCSDVPARLN